MAKKNKIKFFLVFCAIFLLPAFSFADLFPENAQSVFFSNSTGSDLLNYTILDNPTNIDRTILSVVVQNKDLKNTKVYCDGATISDSHQAVRFYQTFTHRECSQNIKADIFKESSIEVIYTDYKNEIPATENLSNRFSAGEMFISLLLLVGLVLAIIALLRKAIFSVLVHRKFIGVNQIEGKEKFRI